MKFKYKKFFSYYKPYLRLFLSVMLFALIGAAITLILPLLIRYITKNVLQGDLKDALDQMLKIGCIMLLLIGLQLICSFYVDYKGHAMGAMMERDMRGELFEHYQKLSFGFYDEQKTGKLMSRITNDLLTLSELYHHGPEDYVVYSLKFFGTFLILLSINVKLTLAVFAFLPFMAVFSFHFNKRMRKALEINWDRIGDINAQVEDSLSGIRVVKSFVNEEIEKKKFAVENNRFLESRKSIYRNEAYLYNGMNAFIQLIMAVVIVYGGANIINTSLDLADLITYLLYVGNLTEPIQKLNHVARQLQEGLASFNRFGEILETEPEGENSVNAKELKKVQGKIEFKKVAFIYPESNEYVLKDLSLEIESGDYIALIGSSGVGKTTLCSLIPRFYSPCEGEVLLDGFNINDIKLDFLRRNIGVVHQEVYLFAGTVQENISYGRPEACEEEIIEAAKKANAHEFIMKLPNGYDTYIGQRGVKLSGGQKQRLSIARVFLKNPPVLIFDEATSALDIESEKVIQDSLESLVKGRTTIVIAHRLSTIRNAKRILVLAKEGIIEQGTHEELIAFNGSYAHLYNLQSKI